MAEYVAPLKDMQFVLKHVVGLDQVNDASRLGGGHRGRGRRDPRGSRQVRHRSARRRSTRRATAQGAAVEGRRGHHAAGLSSDAYWQFVKAGWGNILSPPRVRRAGPAAPRGHAGGGDVGRGQPRVQALPDAHPGRASRRSSYVGPDAIKQRFLPNMVVGRVDRHDEPHRAAGRQRPFAGAHARRSPQADGTYRLHGPEDLHHLRRARLHREHRPPGAGAHRGRARGREGHLALRRAEVPGERRRHARARATT